jgi:hypothetical protein
MSDQPPAIGQDPWGADLNTYLAGLESRIVALEAAPQWVFNSAPWQFSNATPPATGSQLRLNNPNPSLATVIDVRKIDSDGADRMPWFQVLANGSIIRIADWNNASVYHRYSVTGASVFDATNAQIPVVWVTGLGVIPNAKINVGFVVDITPYI